MRILYIREKYEDEVYRNIQGKTAVEMLTTELESSGISFIMDTPELPLSNPNKALKTLNRITESEQYDFIIARGFGAFYALQLQSSFKILINPKTIENIKTDLNDFEDKESVIEKLEKCQDYYFSICHDEESVFKTFFLYGNNAVVAENEFFFSKYYNDITHIYHEEMGPLLNEKGAKKIRIIMELLEDKYTNFELEKKKRQERHFWIKSKTYDDEPLKKHQRDKTVLGIAVEDFVRHNQEKTVAALLGANSSFYTQCPIENLGLCRNCYNWLRRYMDPPLGFPTGIHFTMDELLDLNIGQLWEARNMNTDLFIEIIEKTETLVKDGMFTL